MPRSKKTVQSTSLEETPVVEQTTTEITSETNEIITTTVEPTLNDAFTELLSQLNTMRSQITTLSTQIRSLRSRSEREIKAAQKASRKRRSTNRKPSGFIKPTLISTELASFLGKPKGTEMARTEVTKEINQYIRSNNLQDPANGRRILADNKLRKLLKLGKNEELTYFNLQRYMKPHFATASEQV